MDDNQRDLQEQQQQALELAQELLAWLRDQPPHACQADLDAFLADASPERARRLAESLAPLDQQLREEGARAFATSHKLMNRLGSIERLSRDLRTPPVSAPSTPACDLPTSFDRILLVEDEPDFRRRLVDKVGHLFPRVPCIPLATWREARTCFERQPKDDAILVLLDLGLPESEDDDAVDTRRGLELLQIARAYKNLWRVVVITTPRNYLGDHVEATRLGIAPEDYIFKIGDDWERELDASLRRQIAPAVPRIEISRHPELDRGTIRAGNVEFTLEGQPFQLLLTIAQSHRHALTAAQIESLLEHDLGSISDTLLKIRRAFVDAFKLVGRPLAAHEILKTREGTLLSPPTYCLVPPARVVTEDETPPPEQTADRLLVIDDDPLSAREITGWLESLGLSIETAASSEDALARAASFRPHIVCLDLALPRRSGARLDPEGGLKVLDGIRDLPGLADVRAVVVSAMADDDKVRRKGLLRGIRVDDWLHKTNPELQSWLMRSCSRLRSEIERGVVLAADARSPWVLEISATRPWAALAGRDLELQKAAGRWRLLKTLAERPYLAVSNALLADELGLEDDWDQALRSRVRRLRRAAGEKPYSPDTFIHGFARGYMLRATVVWTD